MPHTAFWFCAGRCRLLLPNAMAARVNAYIAGRGQYCRRYASGYLLATCWRASSATPSSRLSSTGCARALHEPKAQCRIAAHLARRGRQTRRDVVSLHLAERGIGEPPTKLARGPLRVRVARAQAHGARAPERGDLPAGPIIDTARSR
eukprot:7107619-Prymnesium_polylepis.2